MNTKTINSNGRLLLAAFASIMLCAVTKTQAANLPLPNVITPGSQIQFLGNATLDGPIATATAFTSITGVEGSANPTNPVTQSATGSYLPVPNGTPVQFNTFTFGGATPSSNFVLWNFTNAGVQYSFFVNTVSNVLQIGTPGGGGILALMGTGIATIGADVATANWTIIDTTGGAPTITFSASFNGLTPVPEPSTYALIAVSVVLFGLYRHFSGRFATVRIKQKQR